MAEADYRLMTEATGQRIAAALEALHLATVTGVKGDAEQNYRHGDVNITPANIGAVAVDGSNAMHNWIVVDASLASNACGIDIGLSGDRHWYLYPTENGAHFNIAGHDGTMWFSALRIDMATKKVSLFQPLDITYGGTDATTPEGARNNIGIYPFHLIVDVDSNGQGFINFSSVGLSSRPNVCFMEIVNTPHAVIYYDYNSSTSQIRLIAYWSNDTPIINTKVEIQGVAFA